MSTISAGTSSGTALVSTGDTSGNLELQSSGVTKLTVGSGGVTLASALPVASGGTGATSLTANNVILGNGTSAVQFVAPGTNGNVLTSNGTTWTSAAAAGGAWTYISTATASNSATVSFTGIGSTYDMYVVQIIQMKPFNTGSGRFFQMRTSTNNGSSYDSGGSDYMRALMSTQSGATTLQATENTSTADSIYFLNNPIGAGDDCFVNGLVYLCKPSATSRFQAFFEISFVLNTGTLGRVSGAGYRNSAADVDAIQFSMTSGNMDTGTFRLYGIKNS